MMVRSSVLTILLAGLVALTSLGCGGSRSTGNPGAPSPPTPVPPASSSAGVRVLSGNNHQAVPGAHVVISGQEYSTDQNGFVPLAKISSGADVDVQAMGYLPRATRIDGTNNQTFTLWPIASDAEADAVHHMVFGSTGGDPDLLYPFYSGPFYLTMPSADTDVWAAWKAGAVDFGSVFGITYVMGTQWLLEENEISVFFGPDHGCTPGSSSGFCRASIYYKDFAVATERATDPVTIRRVLAAQFLGPNPFPGLLNPDAPADTLSPFEMQTIGMILQRPLKTRWPDNDRQ